MATDKITARRTGRNGSDVGYAVTLLNRLTRLFLNRCFSDAVTALGTTVQKARTTATVNYTIDGIFYTKASTDDLWTLVGTQVEIGFFNVYHLYLDTAAAASMAEGTQATTLAGVRRPVPPDGKCLIGYITMNAVSTVFIPGTTALNAGTVEETFFDGIDKALLPEISDLTGGSVIADAISAPPV